MGILLEDNYSDKFVLSEITNKILFYYSMVYIGIDEMVSSL